MWTLFGKSHDVGMPCLCQFVPFRKLQLPSFFAERNGTNLLFITISRFELTALCIDTTLKVLSYIFTDYITM